MAILNKNEFSTRERERGRRCLEFITDKFRIRDSAANLTRRMRETLSCDANVTASLTAIARTIAIHRSLGRIARKLNELVRGMDANNTAQLNADKLRVFCRELEYNNLAIRV